MEAFLGKIQSIIDDWFAGHIEPGTAMAKITVAMAVYHSTHETPDIVKEARRAQIQECAEVCVAHAQESKRMYNVLHDVASRPDEDFGVLKYAAYEGQSIRDANAILELLLKVGR